jgi:hypothetical protein
MQSLVIESDALMITTLSKYMRLCGMRQDKCISMIIRTRACLHMEHRRFAQLLCEMARMPIVELALDDLRLDISGDCMLIRALPMFRFLTSLRISNMRFTDDGHVQLRAMIIGAGAQLTHVEISACIHGLDVADDWLDCFRDRAKPFVLDISDTNLGLEDDAADNASSVDDEENTWGDRQAERIETRIRCMNALFAPDSRIIANNLMHGQYTGAAVVSAAHVISVSGDVPFRGRKEEHLARATHLTLTCVDAADANNVRATVMRMRELKVLRLIDCALFCD